VIEYGPFDLLLADPPWRYQNFTDKKNGAAIANFKTQSNTIMCSWPVHKLAAKDSLIFLWATLPKLPQALKVLKAWGFEFVTVPFVWNKLNESDRLPSMGVGFWTRNTVEIVILGRRGKGLKKALWATDLRQGFEAPVLRPHSTKPPVVYDFITHLMGSGSHRGSAATDYKKIELFARNTPAGSKAGWIQTGLESDGRDICDAIKYYGMRSEVRH